MGEARAYGDLRGWLEQAAALGKLQQVTGAGWEEDIGSIVDIYQEKMGRPALLFDDVPGYPRGYRVAANTLTSEALVALTLGLDPAASALDLVNYWRTYFHSPRLIAPKVADYGPVLENVHRGSDIDVEEFPTPVWHDQDGGRYIGTGSFVVLRDPDTGFLNCGTYRVQVQGKHDVSLYISKGKHGQFILQKYLDRGLPCPVAISCGHDPLFFMIGGGEIPAGLSEFDVIGGIWGEPLATVRGPATGLPVPAQSEIVIEGEIAAGDLVPEGPFGEFTGYYATGQKQNPRVRVKSILHRHNPILLGAIPAIPPNDDTYFGGFLRSALVWDQLEKAGIPGVTGVWGHAAGAGHAWFTVAIRQMYPGHAKQAGLVAQNCNAGCYCSKYVVVVDDDIDPFDTDQVLWAMCTRVDAREDVEIIRRGWSTPLDPTAYPAQMPVLNARLVIDACRPWEQRDKAPAVARQGKAARARALARFPQFFNGDGFR